MASDPVSLVSFLQTLPYRVSLGPGLGMGALCLGLRRAVYGLAEEEEGLPLGTSCLGLVCVHPWSPSRGVWGSDLGPLLGR